MSLYNKLTILALLLTAVFLLAGLAPAFADRDIVYSARYYLPPGSHGSSHFHLYRINPDGSRRTQITSGKHDDQYPTWSPNGRWIVFQRDNSIAVLDSSTLSVRTLLPTSAKNWYFESCEWSPDSKRVCIIAEVGSGESAYLIPLAGGKTQKVVGVSGWDWSPDGHLVAASFPKGDEIMDLMTGKRVPATTSQQDNALSGFNSVIWLGNRSLVAVNESPDGPHPQLALLREDGTLTKQVVGSIVFDPTVGDSGPGSLMPSPLGGSEVTYVRNASISTWTAYDFYLFNLQTGKVSQELAEGQFLSWSPDYQSFCTAPHRDLSVFEGRGKNERSVWTAPLQMGSRNSSKLRTITPGLVYVTGADWRKTSR